MQLKYWKLTDNDLRYMNFIESSDIVNSSQVVTRNLMLSIVIQFSYHYVNSNCIGIFIA